MADTVSALVRAVYQNQLSGQKDTFQVTRSLATCNEIASFGPFTMATNSSTTVSDLGSLGTTGTTNAGKKIIGVRVSSTQHVVIRFNTSSTTGQFPVASFFLAESTSVTGLRVANPSTTNTATVEVRVWDV